MLKWRNVSVKRKYFWETRIQNLAELNEMEHSIRGAHYTSWSGPT